MPGGQTGVMTYDAAGNQITDTYTGAGAREYDSANKMTRAWGGNNQWQEYVYNADGKRVRQKVDGQETWQIYGMSGDILAEYAANGSSGTPQKEFGYRDGQLLVSATTQVQWLVSDHLGTPRMIVDQTGSLANLRRHDYLPFGEELFAPTGGRSAALGYASGDGVQQQFTGKERDAETGLDYLNARYYSNIQGRFTGSDPGAFTPADPQNLNRYSYVQNSPLKFIDPTGRDLYFTGAEAVYIVGELERFTGLKLNRDPKTGKVTIDKSVKRNMKGTSTWFANKVIQVIRDPRAQVEINTGRNQPGVFFDAYATKQLDVADYDAFKKADEKFAAESLAHVIEEYYHEQIIPLFDSDIKMGEWVPAGGPRGPLTREGRYPDSHFAASGFESQVLSDFTGWWEKPFEDKPTLRTSAGEVVIFEFSTVIYDVTKKNNNVVTIFKYEKQKPRKN